MEGRVEGIGGGKRLIGWNKGEISLGWDQY